MQTKKALTTFLVVDGSGKKSADANLKRATVSLFLQTTAITKSMATENLFLTKV
ncbi:MAG: hypothetical protein L6V88_02915 [Anaerotruncus sp.]|nr:MAG: hypothetical protein L6V88_02915 [Anaerotruncus sp.]